jgi:uncharacterized membrane protein
MYSRRPIVAGRWTVKDILQGKPLRHPSHALFVHFPSALLPVALLFDLLARLGANQSFVRAAFYDLCVGLLLALPAVLTGLVDYLPMVRGSRKRQLGTRHLRWQLLALAAFGLSLLLRLDHLEATATPWPALIAAAAGTAGIVAGNFYGGELVYRQGMRVSTEM